MNSHEVFIHIHQGCFAGTRAIVRLPQCQWSKSDGYGKISQCITTTKHSKAKTVCIFLGIYCNISIDNFDDVTWSVTIFSYQIPERFFYLKNISMTCLPLQKINDVDGLVQDFSVSIAIMHWRYCTLALNHWYIFAPTHFHGHWSNQQFHFTFVTGAAGRVHVLMAVIQCSHDMINLLEKAIILWGIETNLFIFGVSQKLYYLGRLHECISLWWWDIFRW